MKRISKYILYIWIGITLMVYASVLVSPLVFEYGSIISFGIPVMIIINVILLALSIARSSKKAWIYLILLVCAWPFFNSTLGFNSSIKENEESIKVLSYNVKWFLEDSRNNYDEVINWVVDQKADILCFQEYYPKRNISQRIVEKGGYYNATFENRFNVALYSKFPIVEKGLLFSEYDFNNVLFADLKKGNDTIRVYSVHLQSMGINPEKIQDSEGIKAEYENVMFRIVKGSQERTKQLKKLLAHAQDSPHPVIIAGDFNDTPFSYNYFQVRADYNNAFEEAGKGLGVSYNGKIPFLRIDNQFFSNDLEAQSFKTFNDVYFSDHFPVIGNYIIKD